MNEWFGILLSAAAGLAAGWGVNTLADVLPYERRTGRWRRPVVALFFAGAGIWLWLTPQRLGFWPGLLLVGFLGVVTVIDLEHRLILHKVNFVGAILTGLAGYRLHGWQATLLGGAAGFGLMLFLYLFGLWLMGWVARRRGQTLGEEPLGFGDVIFGGVLGLLLGWPGIIIGVMLTIMLAGGASLVYMLVMVVARRYRSDLAIAYGPFMALSGFILIFLR